VARDGAAGTEDPDHRVVGEQSGGTVEEWGADRRAGQWREWGGGGRGEMCGKLLGFSGI